MALFVVAYDLKKTESEGYNNLIDALKMLDSVHTQKSVWYVDRFGTAPSLYNHLKAHIHDEDALMVVEFDKKPAWRKGMPGTKVWIDSRFP
jgi:hypothetical protein